MTSVSILFRDFKKEYPNLLAVLPHGLAADAPPAVLAYGKMKDVFSRDRNLLWRAKNGNVSVKEARQLIPDAPELSDAEHRLVSEAFVPIACLFYDCFEQRDGRTTGELLPARI